MFFTQKFKHICNGAQLSRPYGTNQESFTFLFVSIIFWLFVKGKKRKIAKALLAGPRSKICRLFQKESGPERQTIYITFVFTL